MADADLGFLKIEAVNFGNAILDTNQLSVVRGGSYALKQIIIEIEKILVGARLNGFKAVTVGSSTGVFCCAPDSLENLRKIVNDFLASQVLINDTSFCPNELFTFVVDDVISADYLEAKERLFALGRFKQASRLSQALPDFSADAKGACTLNGLLGADTTNKHIKAAIEGKVNRGVDRRYRIGRKVRTGIYKDEQSSLCANIQDKGGKANESTESQESIAHFKFPSDLETLAGAHPKMAISGKIAVIYADGNAFGKMQRQLIAGAKNKIEKQQKFDLELRLDRARYITSLVNFLAKKGAVIDEDGEATVQLETLLWGGDEMTLVVPAWVGMATLHHFFSHQINICGQTLTSSVGIVFCSHKTPIRKAEQAARELAEAIKEQEGGRDRNYFDYMVLESIDYPTEDISDFWIKQYGKEIAEQRQPLTFALDADENQEHSPFTVTQQASLAAHLETLPRSGVYKLVEKALHYGATQLSEPKVKTKSEALSIKGTAEELQLLKRRLLEAGGEPLAESVQALSKLFLMKKNESSEARELTTQDTLFWLHMLELYDYLAPETPSGKGE